MSDQIAEVDKLGFRDYVNAFVGLITSPDTKPPLTIGIYGPWGIGKSTLMGMIKHKLEPQRANLYLFSWDNVLGNDEEKLRRFLMEDLDIDWAENANISKSADDMTISILKDGNSAKITLDKKKKKATLKITDGKTYVLKVKKENGKLNIYQNLMKRIKKWFASIKKRSSYLSSIDAKNIEEDLNKKKISNDLKKEFETKGFPLSENATIRKEKAGKWEITNEENFYIVEKEDKKLNIYKSELQTICFNAWLYSKEKKLWTAFMKKIFEEIEKNLSWKNKVNFFYSYPNRKVKRKIFTSLLIVFIFAVIVVFCYLLLEDKSALAGGAGFVGFAGWVVIAWHFFDAIKNPITSEMLLLIEKKGEKEDLELMPKILEDTEFLNDFFGKINPTTKIIIFVDDLDRCPDDTSVDVLETVSLLLNIDSFIIILGVDEQVLRKAINLRYKGMLDESNNFLDKIVQIPFHISQPTDPELKEYVSSLIGPKEGKAEVAGSNKKYAITTPIPLKENESERYQFIKNTEYLPKNPRKVKRIINIYRLVKILAGNKRGVEFIDNIEKQSKLIKWLIICEQWPYFVKKIDLKSKSKETYNFLSNILTSTIEEKYLFSIDAGRLEKFYDLQTLIGGSALAGDAVFNKDRVILEELKKEFETKGFLLSENATIRKEKAGKWEITNEENFYIAKKEDEKLNIYKKEIENQEKIKIFEKFINNKPILEAKDIEDFIPFTINFYPF